MKAYKGFNKDMTCKGFQYEEGKTYHEDEAELCESGFHACLNPLDCLSYYNPAESVYHEVELDDVSDEKSEDSKICGKTIKIGVKLSIAKIIEASIEFIKSHATSDNHKNSNCSIASNSGDCSLASNSGYRSIASNSGYRSLASNSGDCSLASNSGDCSLASNSGNYSLASNSGNRSLASNSGNYSLASNSGYRSIASNSGDCSLASNSGNRSLASNSGDCSKSEVTNRDSLAVSSGYQSKARASVGSAICLCERGKRNGETYPLIAVKAAIIDGKNLKPDTWYTLRNGEFVECEDETDD